MSLVMTKSLFFTNIYNTFHALRYRYCHSTILHGSHRYETKSTRWTDGTHTSSHDNSTTFFSDSKLQTKKQGSFCVTLIAGIFKRHLIPISHQTSKLIEKPQTQQHSLQYQSRTPKNERQIRYFYKPKTDLHCNWAKWLCC